MSIRNPSPFPGVTLSRRRWLFAASFVTNRHLKCIPFSASAAVGNRFTRSPVFAGPEWYVLPPKESWTSLNSPTKRLRPVESTPNDIGSFGFTGIPPTATKVATRAHHKATIHLGLIISSSPAFSIAHKRHFAFAAGRTSFFIRHGWNSPISIHGWPSLVVNFASAV